MPLILCNGWRVHRAGSSDWRAANVTVRTGQSSSRPHEPVPRLAKNHDNGLLLNPIGSTKVCVLCLSLRFFPRGLNNVVRAFSACPLPGALDGASSSSDSDSQFGSSLDSDHFGHAGTAFESAMSEAELCAAAIVVL